MKENKYDDEVFFEKYSQMDRSKEGLAGAGEWETLKELLPDFTGKRMLDLGCGYGWHCIYAMEHGAASAVGIDISCKMLEVAREKTPYPQVEYRCTAMEDMEFPKESFDIALSSLAFHYIESFDKIAKKVNTFLKPGGSFLFSVEHPVFTAYGTQDWYYGGDGKYHKTLTTYLNGLLTHGFEIKNIVEPQPPAHMIDSVPGMKDEMRRPMMLIVNSTKR